MTIQGNKTYATAATAIAGAWIAFIFEADMGEGPMTMQAAVELTFAALAAIFLRHGIATGGAKTVAPLLLAALLIPACSSSERYPPNERGAKLAYADGLEALTAAKQTTIRLTTLGLLDAEDIVAIDSLVVPADRNLERAWARIQAGDYSRDTLDLISFVLDAAEQVAILTAARETSNGRSAHHGDRGDGEADPRAGGWGRGTWAQRGDHLRRAA